MEREELTSYLALHLASGIGAKRLLALYDYFGSAERALQARPDEWTKIEGVGDGVAAALAESREAALVAAKKQIEKLPGWKLSADAKKIRKEWVVKDFMTAIKFFNEIARIAEAEDHHPDLHLSGYRNVAVELSTHAIGGLSENDFILAAKIDQIPVELKKSANK